jgi:hypothetical protein
MLCLHLLLQPATRSTTIEYKYVIRAGEGEVKAVVQWQPCNNLEVQAAAEQELTIRDAWEGEQHEVLPGTLPLPAPPAIEPQPAEDEAPAPPTEAVAFEEPAVVAEAAAEEVPQVVQAAAPAVEAVAPAAPAAVEAPEPVKAAESATTAAAPVMRRRRSTTTSRSANGNSKPVNGTNGARKVVAATTTEVRVGRHAGYAHPNAQHRLCHARNTPCKWPQVQCAVVCCRQAMHQGPRGSARWVCR